MEIGKSIIIDILGRERDKDSFLERARITNWAGVVTRCSRDKVTFPEKETRRQPHLYYLMGRDPIQDGVYVGQTQQLLGRLRQHKREKDFWSEVLVLAGSDITIAHTRYLEAKFIYVLNKAMPLKLFNDAKPVFPVLNPTNESLAEQYFRTALDVIRRLDVYNIAFWDLIEKEISS